MNLEAVRQRLEAERAQLLARPIPAPERVKGDEADMAAMTQAKSQAEWLKRDQQQRLAQIDAALARVAAGTYGVCAQCGNAIPGERLEAMPQVTLCVACQAKAEKKRK